MQTNQEWYHHFKHYQRRRIPRWPLSESSSSQRSDGPAAPLRPSSIMIGKAASISSPMTETSVCSWSEYSQNSSLHGLRYIGDTQLHFLERLFWFVAFCLAVVSAAYYITNVFQKWTEMPVIMSLSPTATLLTSIPFPSITICNINHVRKSAVEKILQAAKENPGNNSAKLDALLLQERCNQVEESEFKNEDNRTGHWNNVKHFMIKTSQPCRDMIVACFWHKTPYNCEELFYSTLTDEGICCSFNKIKREFIFHNPKGLSDLNVTLQFPSIDWNPEQGYPPKTPPEYLPWRPWGMGSHLGLTLVLNAEQNEYHCSSEASLGFKVVVHNPVETPKMTAFGSVISPGKETRFNINPYIMTATPQLMSISVNKRNCYFNSERQLRFYRVYNERNCNAECETNFTLQFCHCVMYYMPKDMNTRICVKKDMECASRANQLLEKIMAHIIPLNATTGKNTNLRDCDCLPSCFDLDYSAILATSSLTDKVNITEYMAGRDPKTFKRDMAVMHVYFSDDQFTGIQRGVLFGFTEFLSNTGGLLGLFMGFSFLSAVEALYFLSLRIWCSVSKRNKQKSDKVSPSRHFHWHQNRIIHGAEPKTPFPYVE